MFTETRQNCYDVLATLLADDDSVSEGKLRVHALSKSGWWHRRILSALADEMSAGATVSDAVKKHPHIFPKHEQQLIAIGESKGRLLETLSILAKPSPYRQLTVKPVIGALYGLTVTAGVVYFLAFILVPQFELMYYDLLAGEPLPALTRWYIAGATVLNNYADLLIPLTIAISGYYFFRRLAPIQRVNSESALENDCWTLCQYLQIMAVCHVPLNAALDLSRNAVKTPRLTQFLDQCMETLIRGIPALSAVSSVDISDGPLLLLRDGVADGAYDHQSMLVELSNVYHQRLTSTRSPVSTVPLQLLLIANGVVIVGGVLAVFLPFIKLNSCLC